MSIRNANEHWKMSIWALHNVYKHCQKQTSVWNANKHSEISKNEMSMSTVKCQWSLWNWHEDCELTGGLKSMALYVCWFKINMRLNMYAVYVTLKGILPHLSPIDLSTLITWTSPFPILGALGGIFHFFPQNFSSTFCKQAVKILIRPCIKWCLIWIYTFCLCIINRTQGLGQIKQYLCLG